MVDVCLDYGAMLVGMLFVMWSEKPDPFLNGEIYNSL
jgi:hypothetical protein